MREKCSFSPALVLVIADLLVGPRKDVREGCLEFRHLQSEEDSPVAERARQVIVLVLQLSGQVTRADPGSRVLQASGLRGLKGLRIEKVIERGERLGVERLRG